jgi:hypothetical protein
MQKNAEYGHQTFVPPNNPIGNALTQWAQGVKSRSSVAGMANALNDNLQQMATPEGALNLVAHTAWHGSPHLFDKFKNEAIGTGEGNQAYGMGHYLAEAKDVGQEYQRVLSAPDPKTLTPAENIAAWAHSAGSMGGDSTPISRLQGEIDRLDYYGKFGAKNNRADYEAAMKLLENGNAPTGGALYKTDIPDAHIDKMMDYDTPITGQSQHVQDALANTQKEFGTSFHDVPSLLNSLNFEFKDPSKTSAYLASKGIPGIKYLDGSSRAGGEGTRNFVMFNPDDIRILERNGQATGQQPFADDLLSQFKAQQANK